MRYSKAVSDAYEAFVSARAALEAQGIAVLSGECAEGVLTLTTDLEIPPALLGALGLTEA